MTTRIVVLLACAGALVFLSMLLNRRRERMPARRERVDVQQLGLDLQPGGRAFVVFTTPACPPCKAALRVVSSAARATQKPTHITTVDALERSDLALRHDVRTIPTVLLVTAEGHTVGRWRGVPPAAQVEQALSEL